MIPTGPRTHLLDDPWLKPYQQAIEHRTTHTSHRLQQLTAGTQGSLPEFACAHEYYGLHKTPQGWTFREWAPNAAGIWLVGDFTQWEILPQYGLQRLPGRDVWEITLPPQAIRHGQFYRLQITWNGGSAERIPAYARRIIQDPATTLYAAQVWEPPTQYQWKTPFTVPPRPPLIYEAHIGMAQEKEGIGTYTEFTLNTLPRIHKAGYNTIQLMAIMEHPYYASFGYHISSFFAASSRFGTPEELKHLIDTAHSLGIAVIMDIVHSHAVKNERDGLSLFDGTPYQYFHNGTRGWHEAWDSRCFDYAKPDVLHFLLSNCRYWLDEYRFDGFRFDGVTSMLYLHHGLGVDFTSYAMYFDQTTDPDAFTYLTLANTLIHQLRPDAITIAEDVSGMPGIAAPPQDHGAGFDYRMAMGVPECWFRLVRDTRDEDWNISLLWHELTNRRPDELTVNYLESHDQALVGGKTFLFQMLDTAMYQAMHLHSGDPLVERGVALHKMARLATLATCGNAYLNFIGNEFGHPEWIDFPREGNNNSYHYARRIWTLRDNPTLYFKALGDFDQAILTLITRHNTLHNTTPRRLHTSDNEKILAFIRGDLLFIFNFHTTHSHAHYPLIVPPGRYTHLLDTDAPPFGGQNRITPNQTYPLATLTQNNEANFAIRLYLPSRTALIIQRESPAG